jgi:cold shock CspA family protein
MDVEIQTQHVDLQAQWQTLIAKRLGKVAGTVARIFIERGYGFILTGEGEEIYFHRNALQDLDFGSVAPGLPVELEIEPDRRGAQAARVFPVGRRATG